VDDGEEEAHPRMSVLLRNGTTPTTPSIRPPCAPQPSAHSPWPCSAWQSATPGVPCAEEVNHQMQAGRQRYTGRPAGKRGVWPAAKPPQRRRSHTPGETLRHFTGCLEGEMRSRWVLPVGCLSHRYRCPGVARRFPAAQWVRCIRGIRRRS